MRNKPNSRTRSLCSRRLDLAALIDDVCLSFRETCQRQRVVVEIDVPDNLWVDLDPVLIRDAFRKIIENSLDAMPAGGRLAITSLIGRFGLEIEFADSGPGLSKDIHDRLFEPFTTTKEHRAGLGLSMVRDIVSVHQGSITVADCPEGGTAFTFLFPFRNAARQAA